MEVAKSHAAEYNNSQPAGVMQTCQKEQQIYENRFCMWRIPHYYICNGLEDCIAQVDLSALKESLQTRLTNRRALWRTLKKLMCRIEHLIKTFEVSSVSDFNVTDNCDNVTVNAS